MDAKLPRKHSLQLLLKVPNSGYFGARERVEVEPIQEGNTCIWVSGVNTAVLHMKEIHQILERDLHLQYWWCLISRAGLSTLSLINDSRIHCAVKQVGRRGGITSSPLPGSSLLSDGWMWS